MSGFPVSSLGNTTVKPPKKRFLFAVADSLTSTYLKVRRSKRGEEKEKWVPSVYMATLWISRKWAAKRADALNRKMSSPGRYGVQKFVLAGPVEETVETVVAWKESREPVHDPEEMWLASVDCTKGKSWLVGGWGGK